MAGSPGTALHWAPQVSQDRQDLLSTVVEHVEAPGHCPALHLATERKDLEAEDQVRRSVRPVRLTAEKVPEIPRAGMIPCF